MTFWKGRCGFDLFTSSQSGNLRTVSKGPGRGGTGAKLVAEDVSKPIIRPSGKVELEDRTDARLLASGRERTATFRLYYFAKDRDRPKLENLAVRGAIGGGVSGRDHGGGHLSGH